MKFGHLNLKRCRRGWMLYPLDRLYVGQCLDAYGQYSEGEVAMLQSLLHRGDVVVEVGANIGALTIPAAQFVGPEGRVLAIEPHPETFNVLCANLALNGISNVQPLNMYVGVEKAGELPGELVGQTGPASATPLDSLALARCQLLKIDVDGSELDVIQSGEMLIERFRPYLYFENESREKSADLLRFVMGTLGYEVYFHPTPLFEPGNFFNNSVNVWAPTEFASMMMLGVPREHAQKVSLRRLTGPDDWWDFSVPVASYYLGASTV